MHNNNHKRRASTLSKALLTAGLLGGAALSTLGAGSAQASRVIPSTWPGTTAPFTAVFDIENGTPDRGPAFGGQLYVTLLTEDPESSDPSQITGFGPESYWQSNEPGATPESVTLLPIGTIFGNAAVTPPSIPLPDGGTDNLWSSTQPQVNGYGFAFYYGSAIVPEESYQIFSKPSNDPRGFSYYGCWGEGECVNVNQVPAPAPLPLLGVGAAFGFSRNLRKRIKTSKSPEVMSALG
ncbi:MAG: hypothetical protein RLZZ206_3192 [Cyanobacteriota bacterium]|jgi:hypothetical protein